MILPEHLRKAIVDDHVLFSCQFEVTWKCNEACVHCYQRVDRKLVYPKSVVAAADDLRAELKTDEILRILGELRQEGCFFLTLTGGDPLVRRDFKQIAQCAHDLGFVLSIMTNGLRIDRSMADFLAGLNIHRVEISIYGACAETHDAVTQVRGSFDKTLQAIGLLVERGVRVYLKNCILRPAFEEVEAMETLAASFGDGIDFIASAEIVPRNDGSLDVMKWAVTNEQLRQLFRRQIEQDSQTAPLPRIAEPAKPGDGGHAMCGIGESSFNINPLGHVYACVSLPFVCGDLRKQSLHEIWQEGGFFNYLKGLRNSDLEGVDSAANGFRCPGGSYLEHGDLTRMSTEASRMGAAWEAAEQGLVQIRFS